MTPQEAAEQYVKGIIEFGKDLSDVHLRILARNDFEKGAKWQSEQDNQALSSALKEIAELHAKVNEMKDKLKQHLPEECIERYAEVKFCPIRNGDGWQCKECAND